MKYFWRVIRFVEKSNSVFQHQFVRFAKISIYIILSKLLKMSVGLYVERVFGSLTETENSCSKYNFVSQFTALFDNTGKLMLSKRLFVIFWCYFCLTQNTRF